MVELITALGKKIIPKKIFISLQPFYHRALSWIAAVWYRYPSRELTVIGVTGTKGKTTVTELINAIFEEAGYRTALSSTLRFKIGTRAERNRYKMTMPGRFFVQRFLRQAVSEGCRVAILEVTSEGVKQYRHKHLALDALVFTNLSPEHIESHGSFEAYKEAKLDIARALADSPKKRRVLIVNKDDAAAESFLAIPVPEKYTYSLKDAEPYTIDARGIRLTLDNHPVSSPLSGLFNLSNILAAAAAAHTFDIGTETIVRAIEACDGVHGRVEFIREGQPFDVVVDYAHTPDSLKQFYSIFASTKNICILGNTGGGRDTWKRPEMAKIAETHCEYIYLTNEDPYDENPDQILDDMVAGLTTKKYEKLLDRRLAIRKALERAASKKRGQWSVLITGKGTDPFIMGPGGSKSPWDDATVVREELRRLLNTTGETRAVS